MYVIARRKQILYERSIVDKDFFPKGAIASFLILVGVYAAVWLTLYMIMVYRG